jgi:hypothetical protein
MRSFVRALLLCAALAVPALAFAEGASAQSSCGDFPTYGDISLPPDEGFLYTVNTGDVEAKEIRLDYHDGTFANVANVPPSSTVTLGDPTTPPAVNGPPENVEPKTWPQGAVVPVDLVITGSAAGTDCANTVSVASAHVGVDCSICKPCPVCTPAASRPPSSAPGKQPPGVRQPGPSFGPQVAAKQCDQTLKRRVPAWGTGTKRARKCVRTGTQYSCRARVYCARCACHCWYSADVRVTARGALITRISRSRRKPSLTPTHTGAPRSMVVFPTRVPLLGPTLDGT